MSFRFFPEHTHAQFDHCLQITIQKEHTHEWQNNYWARRSTKSSWFVSISQFSCLSLSSKGKLFEALLTIVNFLINFPSLLKPVYILCRRLSSIHVHWVYSNSIEVLNQHWLGWIRGKPTGTCLVFFRVKRAIKVVKETLEWKVQKGMQQESLHLAIASYRWDIPLMILQYNDTLYKGAIG